MFPTEFDNDKKQISVREATGLAELRELIGRLGASPADIMLAEKLLLVEGANDAAAFQAWLRKAPSYPGQGIAVLSLGGHDAASANFDAKQWRSLHPKITAIIDSERRSEGQDPASTQQKIRTKLEAVGIRCHLTERRATENYFTPRALKLVYGDCPEQLDQFGEPELAKQGVNQFTKSRNGEVAETMDSPEVKDTDIGVQIEDLLRG